MPTDVSYEWGIPDAVQERRKALIAKWRAMGCTEGKILTLMQRRIRSRRQWW